MCTWSAVASGTIVSVLAAACLAAPTAAQERPLTKVIFSLDFIPLGRHAPWYAALAQGYFKDEGLDVSIIPSQGTAQTIQAVESGTANIAFVDVPSVVLARANGSKLKMVAVNYQKAPYAIFSLSNGANVTQPKQLEGLTLGSGAGSFTPKVIEGFMAQKGLDPSKLKITNVAPPARATTLLSGQVPAIEFFVMAKPGLEAGAKDAKTELRTFLLGDHGLELYSNGIATTEDFLARNPDVVKRFVRAGLKGWKFALANPQKAADDQIKFDCELEARDHRRRDRDRGRSGGDPRREAARLRLVRSGEDEIGGRFRRQICRHDRRAAARCRCLCDRVPPVSRDHALSSRARPKAMQQARADIPGRTPAGPVPDAFGHFRDVRQEFPRSGQDPLVAIAAVSFDLNAGTLVTLLGPSGCGKTTFLKIVGGLMRATGGVVRINGIDVTEPQPDFGIAFQQSNLMPWRSVLKNVLFPMEIRHENDRAALQRAMELLALVDLVGFEQSYPSQLSGGMQQRVALCRALIHRPRLLLMDEPFGALDELTRMEMQDLLLDIRAKTDATVMFVTHSISEAIYLSDVVVVFSKRPAVIADYIEVGLPYPRRPEIRYSAEFTALEHRAGRALGITR